GDLPVDAVLGPQPVSPAGQGGVGKNRIHLEFVLVPEVRIPAELVDVVRIKRRGGNHGGGHRRGGGVVHRGSAVGEGVEQRLSEHVIGGLAGVAGDVNVPLRRA